MKTYDSIEDLINQTKKKFHMLIKFGTKENLQKLQKGQLYMKNISYYNNLEYDGVDGKPNKYDGKTKLEECSVTI